MSHRETVTVQVPFDLSAGTAESKVVPNPFEEAGVPSARVKAVSYYADADLALNATNYFAMTPRTLADDADLGTAITNEDAAITKGEKAGSTLSGANLDVASGKSFLLKVTHGGTGGVVKGFAQVTFEANSYSV